MHASFADSLADPNTHQPLSLQVTETHDDDVVEGWLVSSTDRYPIVGGIPRFAGYKDRSYVDSFSFEWNRWSRVQFDSENAGGPMEGYTARMWERITERDEINFNGELVGEFGCGSGRFLDVVRRKGGRAIGLDLSYAVETAWQNLKGDGQVAICQADVLHPPLRPGILDGGFSIGVLHHTPDPQGGFEAMARSTRPGGWLAVSVYPARGFYDFATITLYRQLFRRLAPWCGHYPALLYSYFTVGLIRPLSKVPIAGQMLRAAFPFAKIPDRRWALLDTFDAVTPSYQSTHECYEVFSWLKACGLVDIEPSRWGPTAWHGRKPRR